MSDYQRWELMEDGTMIQSPDGGWVLVGDYSCLKREAYILSIEHQNLKAENERLKAEVERLRKAGDDLYKSMLEIGCNEMADNFQYDAWWGSMKAWQSAKEGKPSEQKSPSFIEDLGNGVEKHDLLFRYPSKETPPHA